MASSEPVRTGIIDTDVHQSLRSPEDLYPYLDKTWRHYIDINGLRVPTHSYMTPVAVNRRDAAPEDGGPAGSDYATLCEQLLDEYGITHAILTGSNILSMSLHPNLDYAGAVLSAYNDWVIDHWFPQDERLLGSILVSAQDPERAVREIERLGPHPRMVQVMLPGGSRHLYGQRFYWPIYEAAQRHNLPVAIHPVSEGAGTAPHPTPASFPSTYLEWHTLLATSYTSHLVSLICEGVFVKFPRLRFVLIEGGVSWLAPLMWRLDKNYKGLRISVPWLTRLPSEYLFDHIRFTTQPIEEPPDPVHLRQIFDMIDAARILMFSSDYPHWDFDPPTAILRNFSEEEKRRIFYENARALYGL